MSNQRGTQRGGEPASYFYPSHQPPTYNPAYQQQTYNPDHEAQAIYHTNQQGSFNTGRGELSHGNPGGFNHHNQGRGNFRNNQAQQLRPQQPATQPPNPKITRLEAKIATLEEDLREKQRNLVEEKRRSKGLKELADKKEEIRLGLESEIMSKVKTLQQHDAKFLRQKTLGVEHAKILANKNEQIANLEARIAALTTISASGVSVGEISSAPSTREINEEQNASKISEEISSAELATAQSTIENQASEIAELKTSYIKLEAELSQAHSEIAANGHKYTSTIEDLTRKYDDSATRCDALEEELSTTTGKYSNIVKQLAGLEENHKGLQGKYDELVIASDAVHAELAASQRTITTEAEKYTHQIQENEQGYNIVVEELEKVDREATSARDSLQTQLANAIATKDSEIEEKNKKCNGLIGKLTCLEKKHDVAVTARNAFEEQLTVSQTIITSQASEIETKQEDYNRLVERVEGIEKERDAAVTTQNTLDKELTKSRNTITENDENYSAEITKKEKEYNGLVERLEKKHKENIAQHNSAYATLQTKHEHTIHRVYLLEQCHKLKAPLYTFKTPFDLLWSCFGLLILLVLMIGFLSSFDLPSGHTIYETIISFFSHTEIVPAPIILSPSIDTIARLQSVLSPVCMDMVSIGPDVSTEFIPPEICSGIICLFFKGVQWVSAVGSHLW